ncbi:CD276 antigen homolog isoform X1 [Oreochromis niloticus]|uniref:CD276 antigen homolog isoform X1 n=2 Tax=Oreochromis niloticus TaxID=8128 RepID=UPI0003945292|nr:CD276 antigen homolog isoform X1 [Oreochromis niloticus]
MLQTSIESHQSFLFSLRSAMEFLLLIFLFLLAPLLLPASCQTVNGSIGETLLWPCMHKLTKKFVREQTYIYWQGMDGSSNPTVAHVYVKGEEEFLYQSSSFQNRTAIFFSQLEDGNFSLLIKNLMLDHDRTFIEVAFISDDSKENICQKTLHVAAVFQEPNIELSQASATCSTAGGYPEPEVMWLSTDNQGNEAILEPLEVKIDNNTRNGTFSVFSKANISGLKTVTCRICNPTSGECQTTTKDVSPAGTLFTGGIAVIVIVAFIVGIISIALCVICQLNGRRTSTG